MPLVAMLAAACSNTGQEPVGASGGAGGGSRTESVRLSPVCPSCVPSELAGGETSDFSGQDDECTGDPAPVADAGELLVALEQVQGRYAGSFDATLRWGPGNGVAPENLAASGLMAAPSGYEPSSRVSGRVDFGEPRYFVGRPRVADDPVNCPSWLSAPTTVELTTADGAIEQLTLRGWLSTDPMEGEGRLLASADLADAVGGLDLHLDSALRHRGTASFELLARAEGKRGYLQIAVGPDAPDTEVGATYPLVGVFPDDGCSSWQGFPTAIDAALPGFGGRSVAQLVAEWRDRLAAQDLQGVWSDCSRAGVRAELASPQTVCAWSGSSSSPGLVSFDAANRIVSTDGRLDLLASRVVLSRDGLSLYTREPLERIPASELAERGGVVGVDVGMSPWLTVAATFGVVQTPSSLAYNGFVRVEGLECDGCNGFRYRETLDWPPESPFAPYCE